MLISQEVVDEFFETFWMVGCLATNKPFDFAAGLVHDPDTETFNRVFATGMGAVYNCNNSAGSAALAEICGL